MKNIETIKLAMMDSPSPPSLKENDETSEPLETLKKAKVDSSPKKSEENGHSENSTKDKSIENGISENAEKIENNTENGVSEAQNENGVEDEKSPESPVQDKAIDSEISELAKIVDVDMKDSDEDNSDNKETEEPEKMETNSDITEKESKTESSEVEIASKIENSEIESKTEDSKINSESNIENSEVGSKTEDSKIENDSKTSSESKTEDQKMDADSTTETSVTEKESKTEENSEAKSTEDDKMETDQSDQSPSKKSEICLEPATNSQTDSDGSDSEEDSKTKSTSETESELQKPESSITPEAKESEAKAEEEKEAEAKVEESKEAEAKEPELPKQEKDYKAALDELTSIAVNAKKINDDDLLGVKKSEGGALKRTSSANEEKCEVEKKKIKLDEKPDEEPLVKSESKNFKKEVKTSLKSLTREQLEDMVTTKMAEVLSARSEIGMLRRKCDTFEEECEKWKKKQQLLQKMCGDLNTVMRRYITDEQNKQKDRVTPIKITRSVGLQVMTDRNRRPQQQGSPQVATKTTASSPVTNKPTPNPLLTNKPVTIATPTTMVVSRPIAPKPMMTTPVVTAPVNKSVAQNISKLPPSVSIIQTPSANTTSTTPQAASVTTAAASSTQPQSNPTASKKVIECVDLSDDEDQAPKAKPTSTTTSNAAASANGLRMIPVSQLQRGNNAVITPVKKAPASFNNILNQNVVRVARHPAPLPDPPRAQPSAPGTLPPKPTLKLSRLQTGIVLSWNMTMKAGSHVNIANYQIYAYQETSHQKPESMLWKKVGDVKALPLPMACTLTQFQKGNKYHFAVRAKDQHQRVGFFSEPQSIALT